MEIAGVLEELKRKTKTRKTETPAAGPKK